MLERGEITAGQARPLIGLSNASHIAEEIISKNLSARVVEDLAKKNKIKSNPNKKVDSNIEEITKKIEESLGLKVLIKNKKNN